MFGFGGGFNGPGGGSTNSGSSPGGKTSSKGSNVSDGDKEGDRSVSKSGGGKSVNDGAKEGDRSLGGSTSKGDRTGGGSVNDGAKEGDRSLSSGVDPSRFGGGTSVNRSTPTGARVGGNGVVGSDGRDIDRSLSLGGRPGVTRGFGVTGAAGLGFQPGWEGAPNMRTADSLGGISANLAAAGLAEDRATRDIGPRGFGYATAFGDDREVDRSLETPSFQSFRSTDLAEMRRAQEDASMNTYRADQALAASDRLRAADLNQQRLGAEATSMNDLESLKASYRDAIAGIESVGIKDPYAALGTYIKSKNDRAYGRYQVMGDNIPSWTKQALGVSMTPKEFLADPKAQDATFDHIFGGYVAKYGIEKAAQAWYGGEDSIGKLSRTDPHGKINVGQYGAKVARDAAKSYAARKAGLDGSKDVKDHPIADRFASKYLGAEAGFGKVPDNVMGGAEADYFGAKPSEISDDESGANIGMWEDRQKEAALGPDLDPGTYPPAPTAPKERSIAGSLLAGGIDVLGGLIPGVGIGVSVVNGGLALTGNRTIGEFMSDSIMNGDNQYQPGDMDSEKPGWRTGDDGRAMKPEPPKIKKPGSTVKSKTFASKYLDDTGFGDDVLRPTPAQKWGERSLPAEYGKSEYA